MHDSIWLGYEDTKAWSCRTDYWFISQAGLESNGEISQRQAYALCSSNLKKLLGVQGDGDSDLVAYDGGSLFDLSSKAVAVLSSEKQTVELFHWTCITSGLRTNKVKFYLVGFYSSSEGESSSSCWIIRVVLFTRAPLALDPLLGPTSGWSLSASWTYSLLRGAGCIVNVGKLQLVAFFRRNMSKMSVDVF